MLKVQALATRQAYQCRDSIGVSGEILITIKGAPIPLDQTSLSHSRKRYATRTAIDRLIDRPVADRGYVFFLSYLYSMYGYQPKIRSAKIRRKRRFMVRDVKDSQHRGSRVAVYFLSEFGESLLHRNVGRGLSSHSFSMTNQVM